MSRYFKVPQTELDAGVTGKFVGGAWFQYVDGVVTLPDDGDYSWSFPGWERLTGPAVAGQTLQAYVEPNAGSTSVDPETVAATPTASPAPAPTTDTAATPAAAPAPAAGT